MAHNTLNQEVVTVPRGPVESGPMWYAQARLGITVWAARIWGAATGGTTPEWHVFCTRVMARDATFSLALFRALLSKLDLSTTTNFCWWSDVGTHFRSYEVLGSVGALLTQEKRLHMHYRYGPEALL